jgi:acetoin:2,6-dichlorophenolindophenol oxidoreductase subunit beta
MSLNKSRKLKFSLAINEAIFQSMESDDSVFLIGQGVKSPWYVGNTCTGLIEKFGEKRVIDTPVSENAITGSAVGAAISGMKSIVVHPRIDFMLYAFDPIMNEAANWHYMYGGASSVPVVIWGIINRGGEQGAQHSQALQALFAHIPGLKVVMPSNAYDAKGLMVAAINDPNPVVYIDDRWLYGEETEVPEELYEVEIGKANILKEGKDLTIISSSFLASESLKAAILLEKENINVEIVDLRTIKPLDIETILKSVEKTGKALIVDGGWKSFGVAAEIMAVISERAFEYLSQSIQRLTLPDIPAPSSRTLEKEYYIYKEDIIEKIKGMLA